MTNLVGKDASLEDTLTRFKKVAEDLGLELIEDQWLNPLPDLWSVHLSVASCPAIYSNGKGSTKEAALASAYGEIYERLATHMSFSDFYLGLANSESKFVHFKDEQWTPLSQEDERTQIPANTILNEKLIEFYTQDGEVSLEDLIDIQSCAFEKGVCSIPFTNAKSGEIVYFPVNLLDNLYASNGMSAGNTEYEALVQGMSEILERYVKGKIIKEGLTLPRVPDKILEKYPKSYATLQALQSEELKAICYDASLGGKFPVICVILFNRSNGTCVASFGSHPIFEVALDRTLTELMQGRTFSDLDEFDEPSFDLSQTSEVTNIESHFVDSTGLLPMQMLKSKAMFKFVAWDFKGSTHDQYKALLYIINKLGFEVYVRTYQNLGVPVYRIIVPGMSEIYPVDDLIYNNINAHIAYQESILQIPSSDESAETYLDYLDELENENLTNEMFVTKLLCVLPDPESAWASLRLGELKCLLALAGQDYNRALEYAQWTVLFNQESFSLERLRFYKCLIKFLECKYEFELNEQDYIDALALLYGQATLDKVQAHCNNQERFNDLISSDLNLTNFKQHQALIEVYQKIKSANLA